MEIVAIHGEQLEKSQKNSPEDFFNRSEVRYVDKGKEHKLNVVYVAYFDSKMSECTPFNEDVVYESDGVTFAMKDVFALIALIKKPEYKHRQRVYVSEWEEYKDYLDHMNWTEIEHVCSVLAAKETYVIESTLSFLQA
ncbi:hypothetical protein [Thalassobacillus sp. CUG 92003]|uniref:hypothetical protein n=1 Tax=Thalassobacillus sp. CUG 92003 TaxID=2736641 RepID=UPI0015E771D2|nr:hypothetical protein [Thalassobacillus sp. CUG 92003]